MKSHKKSKEKADTEKQSDTDVLKKLIKRIRRTNDFPTISRYIFEINQKLSDSSENYNASEVANIILKDYALTNRLLKMVNSAFYAVVSGKVTTVTRAVVLLGASNVRLATIGLALFEHFRDKSTAQELKDAVTGSFWSALIAREIAKQQTLIDPEEAFICALLHRLGRLLTICHMPDDYREIQYQIRQKHQPEIKAVRQVLGTSYENLGAAVAKEWNFPKRIRKTMAAFPESELGKKSNNFDLLWVVTGFTNALRQIVDEVPMEKRPLAISRLLARYGSTIILSEKELMKMISQSVDNAIKHAEFIHLNVEESHFLNRLSEGDPSGQEKDPNGSETAQPRQTASEAPAYHFAGRGDADGPAKALSPDTPIAILMEGIQEISTAMMGDHDVNDIALMSLEIIYRALQCNRAILFIQGNENQTMEARFGYGTGIEKITGKMRFKIEETRDLFNRALQSGEDLIVSDAHSPRVHPLIPKWYRKNLDARAFVFLPVTFQKVCIGAFYADFEKPGPPINDFEHSYLAMLRNQMVLAIKFRR